jgi:polar amino acid transport system substrate-binding protein
VKKVIENVRREGLVTTYRKVNARLDRLSPLGYSSAGVVLDVGEGVDGIHPGDAVACGGAGYASHAEIVRVPKNLCVKVPEVVDLGDAAFATLGAIALQGVRRADPRIGEMVGVIGLGLLGQLTIQILKASGCGVFGVDVDSWASERALENGADRVGVCGVDDVVRMAMDMSEGNGMDVVIVTANDPSSEPIEMAERLLRDRGRVISVGMTGMSIPRNAYYSKELDLRMSRSYGPGRYDANYEEHGYDYPIGYVRWTERRNIKAILELLASSRIVLDGIITHRFQFSEAMRAYRLVQSAAGERYLGILLDYGIESKGRLEQDSSSLETISLRSGRAEPKSRVGISLIGAGSFARSTLLPHFKKCKDVEFRGVLTAKGFSSKDVGSRFDFAYATSKVEMLLADRDADLIVVATRHDTHARYVVDVLNRGKAVFVEKPLALTEDELQGIVAANARSGSARNRLIVGFNRRFAPLARAVKDHFASRSSPLVVNMRVNAGYIPPEHWTQDPRVGGGRIVGEAGHFIDLARYWIGEPVVSVFAAGVTAASDGKHPPDTVTAVLRYADGSVANLVYASIGDTSIPKERYEVFGDGKSAIIDDFRRLVLAAHGKSKTRKTRKDKGHRDEVRAVVRCIAEGEEFPICFETLVESTMATLAVVRSMRTRSPVSVRGKCG